MYFYMYIIVLSVRVSLIFRSTVQNDLEPANPVFPRKSYKYFNKKTCYGHTYNTMEYII